MRRQTRCVGHEAGFGNDPSELQAKSTSIRERSSSLGQTIHRPRRDDRRSSPYQAQCSGTFVDDASAIGFWERLVQVNRLAIQANSFTEMECVFVGSGRIVADPEIIPQLISTRLIAGELFTDGRSLAQFRSEAVVRSFD